MVLTKRVIPCLDVDNGRVVKGTHFSSVKDAGDPVDLAKKYSEGGADEIVFLDITASEQDRETIKSLVSKVAQVIDIPFTVGGGVKTLQHARDILLSGADKVAINTGAVKNPSIITELMKIFGKQCVVVAMDVRRNYNVGDNGNNEERYSEKRGTNVPNSNEAASASPSGTTAVTAVTKPSHVYNDPQDSSKKFWYEIYIYGGKKATGIDAIEWAKKLEELGAGEILLTSIDMDGTKEGYDIHLTEEIVKSLSIPVVASGGCGKPEHMLEVFTKSNVDAALAASIFHYDSHSVKKVKQFLHDNSVSVRI